MNCVYFLTRCVALESSRQLMKYVFWQQVTFPPLIPREYFCTFCFSNSLAAYLVRKPGCRHKRTAQIFYYLRLHFINEIKTSVFKFFQASFHALLHWNTLFVWDLIVACLVIIFPTLCEALDWIINIYYVFSLQLCLGLPRDIFPSCVQSKILACTILNFYSIVLPSPYSFLVIVFLQDFRSRIYIYFVFRPNAKTYYTVYFVNFHFVIEYESTFVVKSSNS